MTNAIATDSLAPIGASSLLLSARQIASWQFPALGEAGTLRAVLPALQRGAVWQARQVEELWDSLARGFPIGAFLLAPFDEQRGTKAFRYATIEGPQITPTHHLLDGQQRSNAIALGFWNPWQIASSMAATAALWIDLEPPAGRAQDDREFVFRLLTRAHPWGYRWDRLADGGTRLSAQQTREASAAYKDAAVGENWTETRDIPITRAWPWDARAAVPLPLLIEAIVAGGDVRVSLLDALHRLPFWKPETANIGGVGWTSRVDKLLGARSGTGKEQVDRVIGAVQGLVTDCGAIQYRIPSMVLPRLDRFDASPFHGTANSEEEAELQDPIETLFIRVNSAGTPLVGEELIYSILKSSWPDAEKHIDKMEVRLAVPSRIVTLAARLVMAKEMTYETRPPISPDVRRFRRLIRGVDITCKQFRKKLVKFFASGEAGNIFRAARDLLVLNNAGCRLPPVLAGDIARRSPDTLFLLLRWVQRMQAEGYNPLERDAAATLRVLGAVTALSWFAERENQCLTQAWPKLQAATGNGLKSFFSSRFFGYCQPLSSGRIGLVPIVPPEVLENAIHANVLGHGFGSPGGQHWQNWTWSFLTDTPLTHSRLGTKLHPWYRKTLGKLWHRDDLAAEGSDGDTVQAEKFQDAWRLFAKRLSAERGLLLFAQRQRLVDWFPAYDPTSFDQREEADRPWDFDHIHPHSHIDKKKNVPQLIRDWHGSIGNLRAWPLQANRGDGADPPRVKLSEDSASRLTLFQIESQGELLEASFIHEEDADYWMGAAPAEHFPGYLGKPDQFGPQRQNLARAIVNRCLRLYRHWYETLHIAELSP